nr:unnamed protein product [Spirometra erinaceieuropaei]
MIFQKSMEEGELPEEWKTAQPPPKRNAKPANHNFAQYGTPPHNRFQRVLDVNGHSGLESDLLDIFGPTAPLELYQPSSPRPTLPPRHRQLTLTILLNHHFHHHHHPPPPPPPPTAAAQATVTRATTDATTTSTDSSDEDQD